MDADTRQKSEENIVFPSAQLLVLLYAGGAVVSLLMAFSSKINTLQSTNCLLISWFLALGALGMSLLNDAPDGEHKEY